ncbi:hypothetical protein HBE96_19315 [Clostridium sp. P21]|uniref:IDEAL domain-containing protein n=1 Tax=Clostridium muellerianum TaxID=2716538 RepID=A0A7Y0EJS3_9CLOT|nr:hypothetical protein [Clostridium muellerianum]NMM64759.1 hypothetical protein [Clostridium muellerianum]
MKINNFVLYGNSEKDSFAYGTKFIPKRTLNKSTDFMIASVEKHVSGKDTYSILFKKHSNSKVHTNSYNFTKGDFKKYIDFLTEFTIDMIDNKSNLEKNFIVNGQVQITLNSLNKEYVKICAIKQKENYISRIFFTLLKKELLTYINILKNIYLGKEIVSSLCYEMGFLINPLSKQERDDLYLNTLYILADSALDTRNEMVFNSISREIQKVLNYKNIS